MFRSSWRIFIAWMLGAVCAASQAASPHRYEVVVDETLERLAVHACFNDAAPEALVAQSDGARFYLESMRLGQRALAADGDKVTLDSTAQNACVDYVVKLQPAKSRTQTGGAETRRVGAAMLTSIGDWLWRPQHTQSDIELRFQLPPGAAVSAPWQRTAQSGASPVYLVGPTPYNWAGIVVFGRMSQREVQVPGATLHIALLDFVGEARQAQLEKWIERTARHVALLYGRFPVRSLQIVVAPASRGRGPVPWAYVSRGGGHAVHLFISPAAAQEDLAGDWSLTHEMAHLFLPYVVARDAWLFEGLPTYLQNVLMARGGAISEEEAWRRMLEGFQRGARTAPHMSLARANERVGHDAMYLRVYWAGAALMLASDLELRARTGSEQSLDTLLDQLSRCCADAQRRWSAQELISRFDELTGTRVFSDRVRAQFEAEGFPDYAAALERAGIEFVDARVQFDASAPWAAARQALMQPAH